MPHDANGNVLAVGDKVFIPGTITAIQPSEEYCNCSVELEHPMPPYTDKVTFSSINTKQVVRLGDVAAAEAPQAESEAHGPE
jgi:hypothetical protein